jgi:hypothetical protein
MIIVRPGYLNLENVILMFMVTVKIWEYCHQISLVDFIWQPERKNWNMGW